MSAFCHREQDLAFTYEEIYITPPFVMSEELHLDLRDNPQLKPFVLSNVRLTGTRIGAGAYGSVEEVAIPGAICAAKDFFQDASPSSSYSQGHRPIC